MTEKTIASFKYETTKIKLLKITNKVIKKDFYNEFIVEHTEYMCVKNRKRLFTSQWEETAKKKLMSIIAAELLQQKITF